MIRIVIAAALVSTAISGCSRSDNSPRPEHSAVAAAMPDAATLPGAVGPATAAPHPTPPPVATLSDTQPTPTGQAH
jgi:hypothetical protein